MSAAVALVLHGHDAEEREYFLRRAKEEPQIVDERIARRLACSFSDGWYCSAVSYLKDAVRWGSPAWSHLMRDYGRPSYDQIRDHLVGDCNVAPLLAARIALWITREVET